MTGPLGPTTAARAAVVAALTVALGSSSPAAARPLPVGAEAPGGPSVHSSDGIDGPLAAPVHRPRIADVVRSDERSYRVVPGVRFEQWDQTDARGTVRAYLLRANLDKPGLSLQYAGLPQVAARDELSDILRLDDAVAGVNGDFFDIADTGAPLGVGVDGSRVMHGPELGWIKSFLISPTGAAAVGEVPVKASVRGRPELGISRVNSPRVPVQGIGLYTARWGHAPGHSVTDGANAEAFRQVVIKSGVVVSNTGSLTAGGAIDGRILIGRGDGAVRLRQQLPVGTRARIVIDAGAQPSVAISGSAVLVDDGRIRTDDDGELHPRTAVGVDTDTGKVLLLVVDGRQKHSRGYTLLELARLMKRLGAEEALNLDGGGSSTMVTRRPSGRIRVANAPSDGLQRPVPNGLQLVYEPR